MLTIQSHSDSGNPRFEKMESTQEISVTLARQTDSSIDALWRVRSNSVSTSKYNYKSTNS